ncbi:MAG: PilZ domain-containing protein [Acidobacteriota bacterium]
MVNSNRDEERRKARRFQVGWDVAVKGMDKAGRGFDEAGMLENLSSVGAFFYLPRRVPLGARLELRIKVSFKKNNWMKYAAEVVRVKKGSGKIGIAVKFDTARPVFMER